MQLGDEPHVTQVQKMSSELSAVDPASHKCLEHKGSTTVNNDREVKYKGSNIKRKKEILIIRGRAIVKKGKGQQNQ